MEQKYEMQPKSVEQKVENNNSNVVKVFWRFKTLAAQDILLRNVLGLFGCFCQQNILPSQSLANKYN